MAVSIVDYLKKQGKDSSYAARKQLAAQNGIQDYRGTAAQNMNLLSMLQKGNTPPAAESNTGGVSANVTAGTGAGNGPSPSGGKVTITGKQTLTGNSEEDFRKSQSTQDYYDRLHAAEGKRPGPYEESDRVNDYMDRLDELEGNKPGKFESKYEDKINSLVDQILNNEKFEYTSEDLANDSLYRLYRENFMRQGNQAMRDTMGAAAGLTGGYGSTYAAAAGQQAFDNKLAGLNDMALEFADRAYAKYLDEIKNKYNQMDMITGLDDRDYGIYRDTVADYYNDLQYLAGRLDTERNWDYGEYRDQISDYYNDLQHLAGRYDSEYAKDWESYQSDLVAKEWAEQFGFQQSQADRDYAFQQSQAAQSQARWEAEMALQREQFEFQKAQAAKKGSGGSSSKKKESEKKGISYYQAALADELTKEMERGRLSHYGAFNKIMDEMEKGYMSVDEAEAVIQYAGIDKELVFKTNTGSKNKKSGTSAKR